jgi:cell division protein FtsW
MHKKSQKIDLVFVFALISLMVLGLISLYSASTVKAFENFGYTTYYITHQILYGLLAGIIGFIIFSKLDYHKWQKFLPLILLSSLLLLIAVKIPGIGFSANGADRWIHFGPIFFQPSEYAKLAIIIYLASYAHKFSLKNLPFLSGILPPIILVLIYAWLILIQPDFGTMLVLLLVAFFMLFVAGINWKYFFYSALAGVLSLYLIIKIEPYRVRRITTFLNPDLDPKGIGYQINQALLAIGSGGLWGFGYGLSRQKHSYLPEVMTDSIFAVIGEELGFLRILAILGLFFLFALKGYQIAKRAPDTFGRMVAFGITSWIVLQAFINIGAILNLLPLTGIPLPFFSYGSTALVANLGAIGILINISQNKKNSFKTA